MDSFVNELPDCGLSNRLLGAPLVPRWTALPRQIPSGKPPV